MPKPAKPLPIEEAHIRVNDDRCLTLRAQGYGWRKILRLQRELYGVRDYESVQDVKDAAERALAHRTPPNAEQVRAFLLERVEVILSGREREGEEGEGLLSRLMEQIEDADRINPKLVDAVTKLLDRQAKLAGADAQHETSGGTLLKFTLNMGFQLQGVDRDKLPKGIEIPAIAGEAPATLDGIGNPIALIDEALPREQADGD